MVFFHEGDVNQIKISIYRFLLEHNWPILQLPITNTIAPPNNNHYTSSPLFTSTFDYKEKRRTVKSNICAVDVESTGDPDIPFHPGRDPVTAPPPLPPPPQINLATFQLSVSATVIATLAHINNNGANRGGSRNGTGSYNHGVTQGLQRACTYKEFTNGKPRPFNGSGGVIALTRWFERTESFFEISGCPEENKVKSASCNFANRALTGWNGHIKALTLLVANSMTWGDLKTMMLKEYFPRGELQKLEHELWNLTVKDSDIEAYTARFSDLTIMFPGMITSESKKVERFSWGLTPPIQGNVIVVDPTTFDSAKCLAQKLFDHGVQKGMMTSVTEPKKGKDNKKHSGNKRKGQQTQKCTKKQQIVAVHAATTPATLAPTKPYAGNIPKCDKCNFHHNGACREMHCTNCNRKVHISRYCGTPT
ncbi:uncharacterized protein LOC111914829 [Lactuca sativa]|uniref:uncharacterized protein LOC111914829 n=1 Tax=Lactuca sativa TaxID=4236 RepID=UPI000CD82582|nr:uncharacterized protein LOC111914829 [Lactuca sativa]